MCKMRSLRSVPSSRGTYGNQAHGGQLGNMGNCTLRKAIQVEGRFMPHINTTKAQPAARQSLSLHHYPQRLRLRNAALGELQAKQHHYTVSACSTAHSGPTCVMRQLASFRHSSAVSSASTAVSSPSSSANVFWLRSKLRSCSQRGAGHWYQSEGHWYQQ